MTHKFVKDMTRKDEDVRKNRKKITKWTTVRWYQKKMFSGKKHLKQNITENILTLKSFIKPY